MASLTCPACQSSVERGDLFCLACGANVSGRTTSPGAGSATTADESRSAKPDSACCPHCGKTLPNPTDVLCVYCLEEIPPATPVAPPPVVHPTRRDDISVRLRLVLDDQTFLIEPGHCLTLGRDPALSPAGNTLSVHDNVSRRHTMVGFEVDGSAWVRDEYSTNGTYLNGATVEPGTRVPLRHGDRLRLAANVTIGITIEATVDGDS